MVPFRKNKVLLKLRFAPKVTTAPAPLICVYWLVPVELARNDTVAPAVTFIELFIVANKLNVIFAAAVTSN